MKNPIKERAGKVNFKQVNRFLARESQKFSEEMQMIPYEEWPSIHKSTELKCKPLALWRSKKFMAQVVEEPNGSIRISINRTSINSKYEFIDGISWDDLQNIKNQIGFQDFDCIELYPAREDVVNVANIRHLFVLPESSIYNWSTQKDH
jgi:hypothetical protein